MSETTPVLDMAAVRPSLLFVLLATLTHHFSSPAAFAFSLPDACCAQLRSEFTPANVPAVLLDIAIQDDLIFADVLEAGPKAGSDLTPQQARDKGMVKNHWTWRALLLIGEGADAETWQIQFGMDVAPEASVGSMDGRYAASSRAGRSDFASDMPFSDVSSVGKPPLLGAESGVPGPLPAPTAAVSDEGSGSGNGNGEGGSDGQSVLFSDAGSQHTPPKIASSLGGFIDQPSEGAPRPRAPQHQG